jgi:hypothetical protein
MLNRNVRQGTGLFFVAAIDVSKRPGYDLSTFGREITVVMNPLLVNTGIQIPIWPDKHATSAATHSGKGDIPDHIS